MVRVRFAPSPTGELHLGGARTALYNYLFARQKNGQFIIRLEDTDRERLVAGSLERILDDLSWLGLSWDEGPDKGGPYAPYIQSQRLEIYQRYAAELIDKGGAYYCFCSQQRLDVLRQVQQSEHKITKYDRACLNLKSDEITSRLKSGLPKTVRLKVPPGQTIFNDLIRGQIKIDNETLDDSILLKSDGYPTYHLANVVDDHLMAITHVIRGEEWLPSTPKHILIYQGFGWSPPLFAHLPNVLNEKKAKLSKRRDGEAVWLATYRRQGYLPAALINCLALLGWHPRDDREFFSLTELEKEFSLERVQKSGAVFSLQKLNWFNAHYIRQLPVENLDALLQPYYDELRSMYHCQDKRDTLNLTTILKDRLIKLTDVKEQASWFFNTDIKLEPTTLVPAKSTPAKTLLALKSAHHILQGLQHWSKEAIQSALEVLIRPGTYSRHEVLWPIRVALTGAKESPDVFAVAWVLGQTETLARLNKAQSLFNHPNQ